MHLVILSDDCCTQVVYYETKYQYVKSTIANYPLVPIEHSEKRLANHLVYNLYTCIKYIPVYYIENDWWNAKISC